MTGVIKLNSVKSSLIRCSFKK